MNGIKVPVLRASYMRHFSCIGGACEDSCCSGWNVSVDRNTYKKYKKLPKSELASLIDENIKRVRDNSTDQNYARIEMDPEDRCPLLSTENLCTIQIKLGEKYLSNICATFPRISNMVNGVLEKSGTVSCPELARLALLEPDGIEFDEIEEDSGFRVLVKNQLDTDSPDNANRPEQYFWQIRIFTIQVLQDRRAPLNERLIILGLFFRKVQELIDDNRSNEIPQLVEDYIKSNPTRMMGEGLTGISGANKVQMLLLTSLLDTRLKTGSLTKRYLQCFEEFLYGIHYSPETKAEEIVQYYEEAYIQFYQPFMNKHDYILENYLVNYVFKNLFPFNSANSVFDEYVMMVLHYSIIKLLLIGLSGHHKGLNTELALKLIQSFSKTFEHDTTYLQSILKALNEKGYTSMAYMVIFLKN
ncbi:MAG: lysine-N-methylase [Nitrospiraceae bacterium]|nr:MAG: lysine-N-methylase [Nitrospiraceae bacterium]